MGQKVNPIGLRIGINKTWDSVWFPPKGEYPSYLAQDLAIRKYLKKLFHGMGVSKVEIQNTAGQISINIFSAKPGLIIGQQGSKIEELREKLEKKFI